MRKFIKIFIITIGMSVGLTSCFNEEPIDKLSEASIWVTPILLDGYVTPWYRNMSWGFSFYMPTLSIAKSETREYLPWYGDQIIISKSDWYQAAYGDIMKGDATQIQLLGNRIWTKYYTQIRSINFLFENADKIKEGDQKTRILGEAHFFRAYYYYMLLRRYGAPILITKTYDPLVSSTTFPRATFEEMVNYITSEAELAASYLKPELDSSEKGRVTKGAALMLKAKTYFWAASSRMQNQSRTYLGFSDDRTREMLENTIKEYDKVINLGIYNLVPITGTTQKTIAEDYRKIFTTKFSQESIFEVNHSDNGDFADAFGHKLDREAASPFFTGTTAANVPTENHYDEYRMVDGTVKPSGYNTSTNKYVGLDYRFYANVLYDGAIYNGHIMDIHYNKNGNDEEAGEDLKAYDASTSSAFTATGYYLAKFRNEGQRIDASETYASSQNYIIWRLAELYLDYAEANSLLGKNDIALEYVNKVRERVKVTPYSSVTLNDVLNERRVELAFEETTYWDVLRHNQAVEKFSYRTPIMGIKIVNNAGNYSYTPVKVHSVETAVRNFNERNYQLPIPWDEVRYHKIEQNPGYVEN